MLEWSGQHYLIDGINRINRRVREKLRGPARCHRDPWEKDLKTFPQFRIFVLCAALFASPPAAADWASDEAEIRGSIAASAAAFNRGDLPGHLAIYDESVQFMTKNGPRPGIAPIEKAFREAYFKDGKAIQQLRFEELAVRIAHARCRACDCAIRTVGWRQARPDWLVHARLAADACRMAGRARPFELGPPQGATVLR